MLGLAVLWGFRPTTEPPAAPPSAGSRSGREAAAGRSAASAAPLRGQRVGAPRLHPACASVAGVEGPPKTPGRGSGASPGATGRESTEPSHAKTALECGWVDSPPKKCQEKPPSSTCTSSLQPCRGEAGVAELSPWGKTPAGGFAASQELQTPPWH